MFASLELLHFNPVSFILTLVIFCTLLIILSQKAWKPILKALDERDETIRGDLDSAKTSREEAEKLMAEQKKALQNMREESKKIREEAVAMAAKHKAELIEAAKAEAASVVQKARSDIESERQAAMEDIKNLAINIGVDLARKLIGKEVSEETHREVISASLSELEDAYRKAS